MDNNYQDRPVVTTREDVRAGRAGRGTTTVAWIALLLALTALALAWTAFNRTGQNLEDRIRESVNNASQSVQESTEPRTTEPDNTTTESDGTTDTTTEGTFETDADTGTTNQ